MWQDWKPRVPLVRMQSEWRFLQHGVVELAQELLLWMDNEESESSLD